MKWKSLDHFSFRRLLFLWYCSALFDVLFDDQISKGLYWSYSVKKTGIYQLSLPAYLFLWSFLSLSWFWEWRAMWWGFSPRGQGSGRATRFCLYLIVSARVLEIGGGDIFLSLVCFCTLFPLTIGVYRLPISLCIYMCLFCAYLGILTLSLSLQLYGSLLFSFCNILVPTSQIQALLTLMLR